MKCSQSLQVDYTFPTGKEGLQSMDIYYWDGRKQEAAASLSLNIVRDAGIANAAYSSADGGGLKGSIAGLPGLVHLQPFPAYL